MTPEQKNRIYQAAGDRIGVKVNETIKTIVVCCAGQAEELPLFAEIALKLHQEFPVGCSQNFSR
uniref:hypothetical protein n=1 Tax=Hassallia byssoidea TaxID=482630 RepID=UPI00069377ED|nr:hypothetical protein [Hassalia byssoidea]